MLESYVRKLLTEGFTTTSAADIYKHVGNLGQPTASNPRITTRLNDGASPIIVNGADARNLNGLINADAGTVGGIGEAIVGGITGRIGTNLNVAATGAVSTTGLGNPGQQSDSAFLGVDVWLPYSGQPSSFLDVGVSPNGTLNFAVAGDFVSMKASGTSEGTGKPRTQATSMYNKTLENIAGLIMYYWIQENATKKLNSLDSTTTLRARAKVQADVDAMKRKLGGQDIQQYYSTLAANIDLERADRQPLIDELETLNAEYHAIRRDLERNKSTRFSEDGTDQDLTNPQKAALREKQNEIKRTAENVTDRFNAAKRLSPGEDARGASYAEVNNRVFQTAKEIFGITEITLKFDAYNLAIIPTISFSRDFQLQSAGGKLPNNHEGTVYPCFVLDKKVDEPVLVLISLAGDTPEFAFSANDVLDGSSYNEPLAVIVSKGDSEYNYNIEGYDLTSSINTVPDRFFDTVFTRGSISGSGLGAANITSQNIVLDTLPDQSSPTRATKERDIQSKVKSPSSARKELGPDVDDSLFTKHGPFSELSPSERRTLRRSSDRISDRRDFTSALNSALQAIPRLQGENFPSNAANLLSELDAAADDGDQLAVLLGKKVREMTSNYSGIQYAIIRNFLVGVQGSMMQVYSGTDPLDPDLETELALLDIEDTEFVDMGASEVLYTDEDLAAARASGKTIKDDDIAYDVQNLYGFLDSSTVPNDVYQTLTNIVVKLRRVGIGPQPTHFRGPMARAFYNALIDNVNLTLTLLLMSRPKPPGITYDQFEDNYIAFSSRVRNAVSLE